MGVDHADYAIAGWGFVMFFLLFPPLQRFAHNQTNISLSRPIKAMLYFIVFMIFVKIHAAVK